MRKTKTPNYEYSIKVISPRRWDVFKRSSREWTGEFHLKSSAERFARLIKEQYGPNAVEIEQIGNLYVVWLRVINERWLATFTTEDSAIRLVSDLMGC